jgi:hypothetical protein
MNARHLIRNAIVVVALSLGAADSLAGEGASDSVKCMDRCDIAQTRCLRSCSRAKGCKQKCTDEWDQCHKTCGGG